MNRKNKSICFLATMFILIPDVQSTHNYRRPLHAKRYDDPIQPHHIVPKSLQSHPLWSEFVEVYNYRDPHEDQNEESLNKFLSGVVFQRPNFLSHDSPRRFNTLPESPPTFTHHGGHTAHKPLQGFSHGHRLPRLPHDFHGPKLPWIPEDHGWSQRPGDFEQYPVSQRPVAESDFSNEAAYSRYRDYFFGRYGNNFLGSHEH